MKGNVVTPRTSLPGERVFVGRGDDYGHSDTHIFDQVIKVFIVEPDAAFGVTCADRLRLMGTVNSDSPVAGSLQTDEKWSICSCNLTFAITEIVSPV